MMNRALARWDPLREMTSLRQAMDRLLEESFVQPSRIFGGMLPGIAVDVYEAADKYVVEAALPGTKPEDVSVSVQGNTLTISGRIPLSEDKDRNYLLRERAGGEFTRTFTLPAEIETDSAQASFSDGILTLTLPKAAAYQAKRIPIRPTK